jgi:hypothetical protein
MGLGLLLALILTILRTAVTLYIANGCRCNQIATQNNRIVSGNNRIATQNNRIATRHN